MHEFPLQMSAFTSCL